MNRDRDRDREFDFTRNPAAEELGSCGLCGCRVLVFVAGGAVVLWDPGTTQRRWAMSLMSARDRLAGPRWNWTFGAVHECPPRDDDPNFDDAALRRAAEGWEHPAGEGGGPC